MFKDVRIFHWWVSVVVFCVFTVCLSPMEGHAEPTRDTENPPPNSQQSDSSDQEKNENQQRENQGREQRRENLKNSQPIQRLPVTTEPIHVQNLKSPEQIVCDFFDFPCHINKFLFFTAKAAGDSLNQIFTKLFVIEPSNLQNGSIQKYFHWIKNLSWTFLALFLTFQTIRILALYSFEVNPGEIKDLILRLMAASMLIGSEFWIVEQMVKLNHGIIRSLLETNTMNLIDTAQMFGYRELLFTGAVAVAVRTIPPLTSFTLAAASILFFIFIITMCILFLQLAIRYAEIALLLILGPIVMATIMNKEYNLFPLWWRHLISAVFTQSVQVLMLVILIGNVLGVVDSQGNIIQNFLLAIGFMVLILRTPKMIQDWMYSSGSTSLVGQTAGQVSNIIKMTTNRIP